MLQQLDDHLARTDLTRALPQRAYSAPEVFELEAERIFRNEWLAVCGSEDLPEHGDYLALEVADEPVVVIRGADGELRAFANAGAPRRRRIGERHPFSLPKPYRPQAEWALGCVQVPRVSEPHG